jgi:transposase
MERLFERCAGLDIHKDSIVACARVPDDDRGGRRQETQSFATTTQALLTLLDWLRSYGVTLVGMASTGVYWRAVYYLLEDHMECWLLNAQHLRNVASSTRRGISYSSLAGPRGMRNLRT